MPYVRSGSSPSFILNMATGLVSWPQPSRSGGSPCPLRSNKSPKKPSLTMEHTHPSCANYKANRAIAELVRALAAAIASLVTSGASHTISRSAACSSSSATKHM